MSVDRDELLGEALVEELCRKSAMLWLRPAGQPRSYGLWHVWVDGAPHLVTGGLEQPMPDLLNGSEVDVTVRSKDNGARVVIFCAVVATVLPGTEAYDGVVAELHAKRLNPPDGEGQPARWARESRIVRLEPTGKRSEQPGHVAHRSHAAEPVDSPATTRGRLPFVVGRRARRRD